MQQPKQDKPASAVDAMQSLMDARAKAEVAERYNRAIDKPRDEDSARERILRACRRPRFAGAAVYAKPIGRSKIYGLSVRFAEEALRVWGNLVQGTHVMVDNDDQRILNCAVTDLETNATVDAPITIEKFVERREPKEGDEVVGARRNSSNEVVYRIRATEDAMLVKMQAMAAKLRRTLILQLLPADIKEEALELCLATLNDDNAKDPEQASRAMMQAFHAIGVDARELKAYLGKPYAQLSSDEITELRAIHRACEVGDASFAEFVAAKRSPAKRADLAAVLRERRQDRARQDKELGEGDPDRFGGQR